MTNDELVTFQKFKDPDIAHDIAGKLNDAGVRTVIENDDKFFDATFSFNPLNKETRIKLYAKDFGRANEVLTAYYTAQLADVPDDYYLFEFTDKELFEILSRPDEWGNFDYVLARKILRDRGEDINKAELSYLKTKRMAELSQPESSHAGLIIVGYITAFAGGIFGIAVGMMLLNSKRTLPDGSLINVYDETTRQHGKIIIVIGLTVLVAVLAASFLKSTF